MRINRISAVLVLAIMVLIALTACNGLPWQPVISISDTAWLADNYVYYLREADADGRELWRQQPGGDPKRVLAAIPGACDGRAGSPRFLFVAPDGRLGIGVDCGEGEPTSLMAFAPNTGQIELISSLADAAAAAIRPDLRSGYVLQARAPCFGISPFTANDVGAFSGPVTINGHSWLPQEGFSASRNCSEAGWTDSPVLSKDGRLLAFLSSADPIVLGRSSLMRSEAIWYICLLTEGSDTPRVLDVPLHGALALALSPDRTMAAVALNGADEQHISLIDLRNGARRDLREKAKAMHLSFSPDGRRIVYSDSGRNLLYVDVLRK